MAETPKSSFELTMERLNAADKAAGVAGGAPLTDEQKAAIAEVRKVCVARLAEGEILYRDALMKTFEPAERAKLDEQHTVDRRRLESDRDAAIERIRSGAR